LIRDVFGGGAVATTVALINMKGGVGKSTLAVNLGWQLTGIVGQDHNVLVVDLDPQFNASQYLLGSQDYRKKIVDPKRATIWDVFEQQTRTPGAGVPKRLVPTDAIITVQKWPENRLDLLPSTLELAWSLKQPAQKEQLLAKFLEKVKDDYDLILIDCAPTESVLTTAAYLASDYVLGARPRNAPRAPRSLGNRCDNHVPSCCTPTISVAVLGKGRVGVRIEPEGQIAPPFTGRGDTA
jgi:chromosome partitioning protein